MTAPFVGMPSQTLGCSYAPDLDQPGCGRDPTLHLLIKAAGWDVVALASCDGHASIGRVTGELLAEHPWRLECMITDCWAGLYERTDTPT